jgi:hypothetical protein
MNVSHLLLTVNAFKERSRWRADSQDDTKQEGQEVRSYFQPFRSPLDRIYTKHTHIDQQSDDLECF